VANVVARLEAAGLDLSPAYVGDVVDKYLEIITRRAALGAPAARDELVKRVAASLYEDADVIRPVVEEAERESVALGWSPPAVEAGADRAEAFAAQLRWDRYQRAVADIVARLAGSGVTLSPLFVADVADRYFQMVERQPSLGTPGWRDELVKRIAASLYEDAGVIQQVVGEVEREADALDRRSSPVVAEDREDPDVAARDHDIRRLAAHGDPALYPQLARAHYDRGYDRGCRLVALHRLPEALASFDEIERRFGGAADPAIRATVADAMAVEVGVLGALGRTDEAIATCADVERRFGQAEQPVIRAAVATALANRSAALGFVTRWQEQIDAVVEVEHRFGGAVDPAIMRTVAFAQLGRAGALGGLGGPDQEMSANDDLVDRLGSRPEPELRRIAATGLFAAGSLLVALERHEQALRAYDRVVRGCAGATDMTLRRLAVESLHNRGAVLCRMGRVEEGCAVLAEVVAVASGDAALRSLAENARTARRMAGCRP
jgi:hypothetical protein